MKRTFLAIPINAGADFEALLTRLQKNLSYEKHISWAQNRNIHLTLKFIGDTYEPDIPKIISAIGEVAQRHEAFSLDFNKTGIFGSRYAPRVMWLGLQQPSEPLQALEEDVLTAFDGLGFLRDRQNFVPHLTLGRIGTMIDRPFFSQVYSGLEQKSYIHTDVNEIVFYQSVLRKEGAIHKVIKKFELGGK